MGQDQMKTEAMPPDRRRRQGASRVCAPGYAALAPPSAARRKRNHA